jgi:hypothetical protein
MTTVKVTFKNIDKIGTFIKESSWGDQNEIIPAEIYKVGDEFYKKCYPSWLRRGRIVKMEGHEQELWNV